MDEDIDIDEHDLLDNPAIKKIFPDMSLVKSEISEYFNGGINIKQEPDALDVTEPPITPSDVNLNKNDEIASESESKPAIMFIAKRQPPVFSNKIILGSKMAVQDKMEIKCESLMDKVYATKINIEDIGPYLRNSKRFCNICQILFPKVEILQSHNIQMHKNIGKNMKNNVKPMRSHKCQKCSKEFMSRSTLIKHSNTHRNMNTSVSKTASVLRQSRSILINSLNQGPVNKCSHCNMSFSSKQALIKHIYKVLQTHKAKSQSKPLNLRGRNRIPVKTSSTVRPPLNRQHYLKDRNNSVPLLYRCLYCLYYLTNSVLYKQHIRNKHRDLNITEGKKVAFDGECKYCKSTCSNYKSYNVHLMKFHNEKVNNTVKVTPIITIPKLDIKLSNKDIDKNMMTQQIQNSHSENEEGNDHDYDDLSPNEVNIIDKPAEKNNLMKDTPVLKSVLFKCKRCDIHFLTAAITMNHKDHMESLINWKCHICQRIFKKHDEFAHVQQHNMTSEFTVLELETCELERVLYKCSKCGIHFSEDYYFSHYAVCEGDVVDSVYCRRCDFFIYKCIAENHFKQHTSEKNEPLDTTIIKADVITLKTMIQSINKIPRKISRKKSGNNQTEKQSTRNTKNKFKHLYFKLCYCGTCKAFITMGVYRKMHLESRCIDMKTSICEHCGLVLTYSSIHNHKNLHKENKEVKLQDFKFYALGTKTSIKPPVPEYPKCHKCDVHYIPGAAMLSHRCKDNNFLTCHICNIKLTESVFKIHMSFHYYSKTQDSNFQSILLDVGKGSKNMQVPSLQNDSAISQSESSQDSIKSNYKDNNNDNANELRNNPLTSENQDINDDEHIQELFQIIKSEARTDYDLFDIQYCCASCRVTYDSYDKVVEHCQDHLCGVKTATDICKTCNATLDRRYYNDHLKIHASNEMKTVCTLIEFDIFYFVLDRKVWEEHLFGSIREGIARFILKKTIYKTCKIRMKVIQDGSPELTVYKCNSCFSIVEPDSLVKHATNSCFKVRLYPCAFCGLPFLSYLSRQQHVIIHKSNNITLKSYRIVTFNEENNKNENMVLSRSNNYFYLYQCRNCKGVIDKYRRSNHNCYEFDLRHCSICDLMVLNSDYNAHCCKHKKVSSFTRKNIKVILFGQTYSSITYYKDINEDTYHFDGSFVDYTFYRCVDCDVSFDKTQIAMLNHSSCYKNELKALCPKCGLYILKKKMVQHMKLHNDDNFVRENMNIIPFSVTELQTDFIPAEPRPSNDKMRKGEHNKDLIKDIVKDNGSSTVTEIAKPEETINAEVFNRAAELYKCNCGLHFLESSSIQEHFAHCNPRIAKQKCLKCNLVFTPSVLFDHLILHHGDKKYKYEFSIVNMSAEKCDIVTLYNCVYCNTHFIKDDTAREHFDMCLEVDIEKEQCRKCDLFFDMCSIKDHETEHHKESVAHVNIIDIKTYLRSQDLQTKEGQPESSSLKNCMMLHLHADVVIDTKKYNISEDTLSQIDLTRYNNHLYKCDLCDTHFLAESTLKRHFANKHFLSPQKICHICGLRFSLLSLTKHIYIQHKTMKLNLVDFVMKYHDDSIAEQNI